MFRDFKSYRFQLKLHINSAETGQKCFKDISLNFKSKKLWTRFELNFFRANFDGLWVLGSSFSHATTHRILGSTRSISISLQSRSSRSMSLLDSATAPRTGVRRGRASRKRCRLWGVRLQIRLGSCPPRGGRLGRGGPAAADPARCWPMRPAGSSSSPAADSCHVPSVAASRARARGKRSSPQPS